MLTNAIVLSTSLTAALASFAHAAAPLPWALPGGGSAELVFAGAPVVAVASARESATGWAPAGGPTLRAVAGAELYRNDAALAVRGPARAITAGDTWPTPAPPAIEDYRRLAISTSPNSILVYQPGSQARTDFFRQQRLDRPRVFIAGHHGYRGSHRRPSGNAWSNRPR